MNSSGPPRTLLATLWWRFIALCLLSTGFLLPITIGSSTVAILFGGIPLLLLECTVVLLLSTLLFPVFLSSSSGRQDGSWVMMGDNKPRISLLILWPVLAPLSLLVVQVVLSLDIAGLLSVYLGCACLLLLIASCRYFLSGLLEGVGDSGVLTLGILLVLLFLPIWAGSMVAFFPGQQWLSNLVIALSPLSFFSVLLDIDYLRTEFFYRHTPFGGLRYEYPSVVSYWFGYGALALLFFFLPRLVFNFSALRGVHRLFTGFLRQKRINHETC